MTSTLVILTILISIVIAIKLYELYVQIPDIRVEGKNQEQLDSELISLTKHLESKTWALALFMNGTLMYTLLSTIGIMLLGRLQIDALKESLIHLGCGLGVWLYAGIPYAIFMNKANIIQHALNQKCLNYIVATSIREIETKKIGMNDRSK